jgi:hypothetical protein
LKNYKNKEDKGVSGRLNECLENIMKKEKENKK